MRRKIVKLLFISLSFGFLAGCGSTDGDDKATKEVNDTGCKSEYPKAQPTHRPCCPEWEADACEPGNVCAALGDRTQPLCYAKESRSTGESCTADALCKSGVCEEGSCELGQRNILSLTLSESNIPQTETGSSDTIQATLQVENFSQPLSETINKGETYIFLQSKDRPAEGNVSVQGSETILIDGIAKTWLGGLDKGQYQVGVQVMTSSGLEVRKEDMATITIE